MLSSKMRTHKYWHINLLLLKVIVCLLTKGLRFSLRVISELWYNKMTTQSLYIYISTPLTVSSYTSSGEGGHDNWHLFQDLWLSHKIISTHGRHWQLPLRKSNSVKVSVGCQHLKTSAIHSVYQEKIKKVNINRITFKWKITALRMVTKIHSE